ncbi:AAA family ATPase [Roseomonas sp. CECT 9278]|uniref:AAA family ATPase n=1 Tax=Roseomonas sp. CECT 9278 TaxID=2845823 RepID=UPI001E36121D|nr:AAA family ATPase [Roseomonas sp. CECT 9278]CAH0242892.1 hypothetical protein ROS9278_02941 [Roseomonas sp. CECT 9278]
MNADAPLLADRDQITRFVDALFRHADEGTFVSLRAFYDDANQVYGIETHRLSDDVRLLVSAATSLATRAARQRRPIVFAPPIATFSNGDGAKEDDLQNGLALSVECDQRPSEARQKLEALLGPATIIVASGGEWPDAVGVLEPKLHLHWRLTEPTRDAASHATLKACRAMAKALVGADGTSTPMVHPMRWPGSWHRKGAPRLVRIVSETEAELDLDEADQLLRDAWSVHRQQQGDAGKAEPDEPGEGETRDTTELVTAILTGADYHAPITALAMRYLKGGMADAQAVLTLRGFMNSVPEAIRNIKDGVHHLLRWQARFDDIPRAVSTARDELDAEAAKAAQADMFGEQSIGRFRLDEMTAGEPPRQEFLVSPTIPLGKLGVMFGAGGIGKSLVGLALCLLVALRGRYGEAALGAFSILGGHVPLEAAGASVFLTLEDDTAEIHRRIASLDPENRRRDAPCYVIPAVDLPNFDPALVMPDGRAAMLTELAKHGLDRLLRSIAAITGRPVRLLVLDPAGDFLNGDENDASFVKMLMRQLRAVAARHGCTIILIGHVAKGVDLENPTMRGSGAWIANSRFAYALWKPTVEEAERLGKEVDEPAETLVWGNLVKANHAGAPIGMRRLFARSPSGNFLDVTNRLASQGPTEEQLLKLLVETCADCAAAGLPFSHTGAAGLFNGRADFPEPLASMSRHRLEAIGTLALDRQMLVKTRTADTQASTRFLDLPDGPLATGINVPLFKGSRKEALERYRSSRGL